MNLRELRQVSVGNELMGFMLEGFAELFCTGGVAVLEHPAPPQSHSSVSIWRTPILQLFLQMPGCELLQIAQGLWGAKSPKPTSLLVLNAPDMQYHLRKWQIATDLPKHSSIGLDYKGKWSTSSLKEYPPALNGGLASGIFAAICRQSTDSTLTAADSFHAQCEHMICTAYGTHIGPDFAG